MVGPLHTVIRVAERGFGRLLLLRGVERLGTTRVPTWFLTLVALLEITPACLVEFSPNIVPELAGFIAHRRVLGEVVTMFVPHMPSSYFLLSGLSRYGGRCENNRREENQGTYAHNATSTVAALR